MPTMTSSALDAQVRADIGSRPWYVVSYRDRDVVNVQEFSTLRAGRRLMSRRWNGFSDLRRPGVLRVRRVVLCSSLHPVGGVAGQADPPVAVGTDIGPGFHHSPTSGSPHRSGAAHARRLRVRTPRPHSPCSWRVPGE